MNEQTGCPSCGCTQAVVFRAYRIAELAEIWRRKVGFSPFPKANEPHDLKKLLCMACGLFYFTPTIIGDHSLYDRLSRFDWYYPKNKWEFDYAVQLVKRLRPSSLLEVGCGAGEFLHRLSGCVERVAGIDINEHAVTLARAKGLDVTNASIASMTESFDMILLFQVLEHLETPGAFVTELVKRLKPGGSLVLAVPNPEGYMKDVDVVFLDMPPHHNTCWSEEALDSLAARHGLVKQSYAAEPMNFEYLRAQMFAQIDQSKVAGLIRLVQKVAVMCLLPLLYVLKDTTKISGQTHLIVLKKP